MVGVGQLGQHHARLYAELPGVELVAVVDHRSDRAKDVGQRYGCRALTNIQELPDGIDAVSLVTPTVTHAELGCQLLEQGISTLVEKPIATSLKAADSLIDSARSGAVVLQVGHSERFNPALQAVQEYITKPQFFESHRLGVFVPRSLDIDVVLDLMIHDLDLVLYLTRSSVREIKAVGIPVLTPRVDIANARLEFDNGCVANVTASRVSQERIRKLRFFQPHDYVSLDFHQGTVEMYSLVEEGDRPQIIQRKPEVQTQEPLQAELESFLNAVRGKPNPRSCSGDEGRRALSVALDIIDNL